MTDHLFVYGSLAPGRPNDHAMSDIRGKWIPATTRGRLEHAGWGAELGFPGIVPDPDGAVVEGWLFSTDDLAAHWQRLDEFEGDGYRRVRVPAVREDGAVVTADVYVLRTLRAGS